MDAGIYEAGVRSIPSCDNGQSGKTYFKGLFGIRDVVFITIIGFAGRLSIFN